ncbi:AlkZ family DNA glycosylase [Antrihabitans sp. YC2-6]|nr:AlkZ family DNA glycosylase [Antrihabitans sp. YC2-6]
MSQRALNRATLARQHLLRRTTSPAYEFVEHGYGLQAQSPTAPYFALWARLKDFAPQQLSDLLTDRRAVRIVTMRGTVHLLAAQDARSLRTLMQPMLDRFLLNNPQYTPTLSAIDLGELAKVGRELVEDSPLTAAQLRTKFAELWPDRDPAALAYGLRILLPLLQVPPRGLWGKAGQPALTTIEHWLGPSAVVPTLDDMVLRYLGAYGPASVQDIQAWSGLARLGEVFDRLRPRLRVFAAESGAELFDLPDAPRPAEDTPAPVRILAPFDNILLSHADRTRILDREYKSRLFTVNGIIKPAVLVHGRAVGYIVLTKAKGEAVVAVELFEKIAKTHVAALEREANDLLRFAHPQAERHEVRIGP